MIIDLIIKYHLAHAAGCMVVMVPDALAPTDAIRALCAGVAEDLRVVARYV